MLPSGWYWVKWALVIVNIFFGDIFRIHFVARQQFSQSLRSLKHSVLNRDNTTGIEHYRRIAYHKYITVLTDAILRVEKTSLLHVRHQVGTSYRTDIFPTILTGLILKEISIFIVIIFVVIVLHLNTFLSRRFVCVIFNRWWRGCGNRCRRYRRLCPTTHLLRRRWWRVNVASLNCRHHFT